MMISIRVGNIKRLWSVTEADAAAHAAMKAVVSDLAFYRLWAMKAVGNEGSGQ